MSRGIRIAVAVAVGAVGIALPPAASAQEPEPVTYDYGGGSGSWGPTSDGFVLTLEGGLANPRNADAIVATRTGSLTSPIVASWDDDFAGRVALGWQWPSGHQVFAQAWGFETETDTAGTSAVAFGIGPPIALGFGDLGTAFDVTTEIRAMTGDLGVGRRVALGDRFELQGAVGVRYARYEEEWDGGYLDGATVFAGEKSLEGEMIGVRGSLGGTWRWKQFSLLGNAALSLLDGELTSSSSLTAVSGGAGSALFASVDDGRSGRIEEIELLAGWTDATGMIFIGAGWEQQVWDGIAADPARHFAAASATAPGRDSVSISAYKARISFIF